ncbi:hypothetical protein CEXT_572781, partial [Caerostris extrusa]
FTIEPGVFIDRRLFSSRLDSGASLGKLHPELRVPSADHGTQQCPAIDRQQNSANAGDRIGGKNKKKDK